MKIEQFNRGIDWPDANENGYPGDDQEQQPGYRSMAESSEPRKVTNALDNTF